jgi:16S rRNA processing protein RimM
VDDFFLIAEIKSAFGADGYVLIDSFSDFKERFFKLSNVFVEVFGNKKQFIVESVKEVEKGIILKFSGFDSTNDVEFLLGKRIFVEKENSVKLSENTYYIHDLINSSVFMGTNLIGTIEDVWTLPANDVVVVKDINNRKILIPAVHEYIDRFDTVNKNLVLVSGCDLLYDDEN